MVSLVSPYSALGSPIVLLRYVCQEPKEFAVYWGNVLVTVLTLGGLSTGILVSVGPDLASAYSCKNWCSVSLSATVFVRNLPKLRDAFFQTFSRTCALPHCLTCSPTCCASPLVVGWMLAALHRATAQQWVLAALGVSLVDKPL